MFQSTFSRILAFFVISVTVRKSFTDFYPQVHHNLMNPQGIFSVRFNLDWLSCIEVCLKTESCFSYNYDLSGNQNHTCELSNSCASTSTERCSKKKLRFSKGFVYQQLKVNQNKDLDSCDDVNSRDQPTTALPKPKYYRDCADAMRSGKDSDGLFSIDPDGRGMFSVQCDQKTDGGGWVIIQRRFDGTQSFYLGWKEYSEGFGNLGGEFWLGLDRIQRLASKGNTVLRIDLKNNKGGKAYAVYDNFSLTQKETKFRLNVTYTRGTAGDSLKKHSGHPFSTKDQDNDLCTDCSCATRFKSAWWFDGLHGACLYSDLNAEYNTLDLTWSTWNYKLIDTVMMIRPVLIISSTQVTSLMDE